MKAEIRLTINGEERIIETETEKLLSDVLNSHGAHIDMPCAGKGTCESCSVYVDGKKRLACQTKIEGNISVELDEPAGFKNIAAGAVIEGTSKNPMYSDYGISIDIGTTTVCASLLGKTGLIGTVTRKNPQTIFGADVISRIEKALSGGLNELSKCIQDSISEMISELCRSNDIASGSIDAAVITGNTAMLYLLAGQNPEVLSRAPFKADRLFGEYVDAKTLNLSVAPDARVYLPSCVSAFVGGDIITAVIASGLYKRDKTALLVDIGTNGEIALWHKGMLTCCSTAAGPAFEGAGITNGVYGISGAIDHVWHNSGQILSSTIGGAAAVGICGSGVVDAVAVMLELGIVDETGAFTDASDRLELQNGISITASDIRKIQLAKGSVRAGMETLLEASGIDKQKVEALYIAGGFGSFINLESASKIGLIPKELLPRARVPGNAAHTGASMLLQDKALANVSEMLAKQARTIPLDANPLFTDNYMTYMMFE